MDSNEGIDAATSSNAVGGSCEGDNDCGGKLPRCLGNVCVDSATGDKWRCPRKDEVTTPSEVRYNFHVLDFITKKPPKGIIAKACRNTDLACAEPLAVYEDKAATGMVQMLLPSRFVGYFEVKSLESIDTLLIITKPVLKNTLSRDLPVLTLDTVDGTASFLGYAYNPDKGLAFIEVLDCEEVPQGGIHFESAEGGDPFYLVDQLPSKDTDVTVFDPSSNSANGGFINVPPGFIKFGSRIGTQGMLLGTYNAQIRPRTVTFIDMQF